MGAKRVASPRGRQPFTVAVGPVEQPPIISVESVFGSDVRRTTQVALYDPSRAQTRDDDSREQLLEAGWATEVIALPIVTTCTLQSVSQ